MFLDLHGRDFLSLRDFSAEEILYLIDEATQFKKKFHRLDQSQDLKGKTLGCIFEKSSTRTRISVQVAMGFLGGNSLYLNWNDLQLAVGEPIRDTASVLARYLHGILARVYAQNTLETLATYSEVPVINALSDLYHPMQTLADLMVIKERLGRLDNVKIAWVGDGNNVAHSLLIGAAKLSLDMTVASPVEYRINPDIEKYVMEVASETGSKIILTEDPDKAAKGAHVVSTDTFVSLGDEAEKEKRYNDFKGYSVTKELVNTSDTNYIFLHCLPRKDPGPEAEDAVFYGDHSVIWDQAENRLHTAGALFKNLL